MTGEIQVIKQSYERTYTYHGSSTSSFSAACGYSTSTAGIGGVLDAKLKPTVSGKTNDTFYHEHYSNEGAVLMFVWYKLNNNYYSGISWTYHDGLSYGYDGLTLFKYINGTYTITTFSYQPIPPI